MEPLNLMVSLSHFANDKRENKHGLSERAGRGRRPNDGPKPARGHGSWLRLITALRSRQTSVNPNRPYQGTRSSDVPRLAEEHPTPAA